MKSKNRSSYINLTKMMNEHNHKFLPLSVIEGTGNENEISVLVEEKAQQTPLAEKQSCQINIWISLEFVYNLVNTLAKTGYTTATLITDLGIPLVELAGYAEFSLIQPIYFGMSPIGIGVGIPMAILCALAEAYSHQAESQHFTHTKQHENGKEEEHHAEINDFDDDVSEKETKKPSLTWKQSVWSGLHYVSDVYEGISVPLLFSKLAGLDQCTRWQRGLAYAGMTLFSILGNAQELINTRIAFCEKNTRNTPGMK